MLRIFPKTIPTSVSTMSRAERWLGSVSVYGFRPIFISITFFASEWKLNWLRQQTVSPPIQLNNEIVNFRYLIKTRLQAYSAICILSHPRKTYCHNPIWLGFFPLLSSHPVHLTQLGFALLRATTPGYCVVLECLLCVYKSYKSSSVVHESNSVCVIPIYKMEWNVCVYSGWLSFLPATRLSLPMLTVETHAWILHQYHTRQIYHGNVYLQAQCFRVASICHRNNYYKHWTQALGHFSIFSCTLGNDFITFFFLENDTMFRNCQKPNRLLRNELCTFPCLSLPLTPPSFVEIFLFHSFGWRFWISRCSRELQIISMEILRQTTLQLQFSSVIYTST